MGFYYDIYPVVNSVVKYFIDQIKSKYKIGDGTYIQEIISMLIIFLTIVIIAPFVICRTVLEILLKFVHGKNYVEMLSGADKTFLDKPISLFLNVYILENNGTMKELCENVKEACKKLYQSHPKFSSVIKTTLGYHYFISNKIKFEEIVNVVDVKQDYITKEDLSNFIDEKYSDELQSNTETKLWEVTIINTPIIYNKQSENKMYYAVIIKTTHTLTDAICLSAVHQKYLFDKCDNRQFIKALQNTKNKNIKSVRNVVKYFTSSVKSCQLNGKSPNSISSVYLEENPIYFNMIKEIRNAYKVTFSQVMYTVAVHSICEYFKQKDSSVNKILFGYTLRPVDEDINQIMEGNTLTNDLTFLTQIFRYPTDEQTVKDKLLDVARSLNGQKNSTDSQVMYLLQKLSSYLPFPLLKCLMNLLLQPVTVGFTNIPAIDCASINGHNIKDGFVYVNFYQKTKFVFQIYTYDGRLQVNLTATKNMVNNRSEIDDILKGIFKNIEELYESVNPFE